LDIWIYTCPGVYLTFGIKNKREKFMAGMLQIITYLLAFYLVIKGVEILQIALASNREDRSGIIIFGVFVLIACILAAGGFVTMQDKHATSLSNVLEP
jgi:uncharacterized membrane protein HdeD (DUF308 family)